MADKNFKVKNNIIVNDVEIDPSSPTAEQILRYDGTKFLAANSGIPTGGLEGQILSKITDASYNTQWIDNYADQLRVTCKNGTASQINKGTVVMATGSAGDLIQIAPANADGSIEVKYMLGVATANIAVDGQGYVTLVGPVTGLNTNSYTVGDILYINPSTPGAFTTTEPTAPNIDLPVAIVLKKNASAGIIFVRMWSQGAKLGELQDVNVAGVTNNQVLSYNSTSNTWVPTTVSGVGSAKVTVSDSPPSSPSVGDIWYESDTGQSYIYYDSYWVEIGGDLGPTGATGPVAGSANQIVYKDASNIAAGSANLTFNGTDLNLGGQLNINSSTGDEGGQIFLNKANTNTTITSGVNIDIYQNKLRFFENGGTSRGYYLDIVSGGAGAATNLFPGTGASILTSSGSTVTVVNTTTETNLFSYALSGSAVGDVIHISAIGSFLNNSGGSNGNILRFKIGSTTVLNGDTGNFTSSATARRWYLDVYIYLSSLTSQRVGATWNVSGATTTGWATIESGRCLSGSATSSEDLSTDKNLVFSTQLSNQNNNLSCTLEGYTIRRLR